MMLVVYFNNLACGEGRLDFIDKEQVGGGLHDRVDRKVDLPSR